MGPSPLLLWVLWSHHCCFFVSSSTRSGMCQALNALDPGHSLMTSWVCQEPSSLRLSLTVTWMSNSWKPPVIWQILTLLSAYVSDSTSSTGRMLSCLTIQWPSAVSAIIFPPPIIAQHWLANRRNHKWQICECRGPTVLVCMGREVDDQKKWYD